MKVDPVVALELLRTFKRFEPGRTREEAVTATVDHLVVLGVVRFPASFGGFLTALVDEAEKAIAAAKIEDVPKRPTT